MSLNKAHQRYVPEIVKYLNEKNHVGKNSGHDKWKHKVAEEA